MHRVVCSGVLLGLAPGPTGEWIEELTEKPQHVTVTVLSSTTALTSWTASQESGNNSTIVSVVSLTCQKQKESQRLEKHYCTEVRGRSWRLFIYRKKLLITVLLFGTMVPKCPVKLSFAELSSRCFLLQSEGTWLMQSERAHSIQGGKCAVNRSSVKIVFLLVWQWPILCSGLSVTLSPLRRFCGRRQNSSSEMVLYHNNTSAYAVIHLS